MMPFNRDRARGALFFLGFLGIISALGMALYSCVGLRPRIAALTGALQANVEEAAEVATLVDASVNTVQSGLKLVALLPKTLSGMKGVLRLGSKASVSTGKTADETKKGVAGLVLPKRELAQNSADLKGTARQMRGLATVVDELETIAVSMAKQGTELSDAITALRPRLPSARSRLQQVDQAITTSALPTQAMLLGFALSGLYAGFGLVCLATGFALKPETQN